MRRVCFKKNVIDLSQDVAQMTHAPNYKTPLAQQHLISVECDEWKMLCVDQGCAIHFLFFFFCTHTCAPPTEHCLAKHSVMIIDATISLVSKIRMKLI